MSHRKLLSVGPLLCIGLLLAAPMHAADDVPDPNPSLLTLPAAANAPAPDIIKPGTRLVYYGQSASIPGAGKQLVPEYDKEKQRWVIKGGGGAGFREEEIPGAAGAGFSVVTVGHVDRKRVTLVTRSYLYDVQDKTSNYSGTTAMVTNAGMAADYWVNPQVLAKVEEMDQDGVNIMRMPYVLNNRKFNAIRFQVKSNSGHQAYVYDLDRGLMIFFSASAQGGSVLTAPVGGDKVGVGKGSTMLANGWIMEVKQVDTPWLEARTPRWVGQFRKLRYQGTTTMTVPNVGSFPRDVVLDITPKARGDNWLRSQSDLTIYNKPVGGQPVPPEQYSNALASGPGCVMGLWIPPDAMGKLEQGQTLETNDVTQTKTVVSEIGQGYVTLTEFGKKHRIDMAYDTTTGILRGMQVHQQTGLGTTTVRVGLTGQQ